MPLTSGTRLGPYEIAGSLGAGGMGEDELPIETGANATLKSINVSARVLALSVA